MFSAQIVVMAVWNKWCIAQQSTAQQYAGAELLKHHVEKDILKIIEEREQV